ncbi:TIGR04211 family SH3 domain-containing protein [Algicola sagamiensis]|uniref:TIGR04211 family SH3 domain-containing protein n=1 Tax=Algicola sagamiensis TaxID=163869 RepID=UPI00035F4786|nr:TIGR04211 family SH3 domain-containing protein [Algicola sagamiensis]
MFKPCFFALTLIFSGTAFKSFAEVETQQSTETTATNTPEASPTPEAPSIPAKTAFITDEVIVYYHSGPGKNYRIIGNTFSGHEVQIHPESEKDGYVKITDVKGRDGWIQKEFVKTGPGLRLKLATLQKEMTQVSQQLEEASVSLTPLQEDNALLEEQNDKLQKKQAELTKEVKKLRAALSEKGQSQQTEFMLYGACIAGGGFLLGLIISLTMGRKTRREPNYWS